MPGWKGVWRISVEDLQAHLDAAYQETAERIAAGGVGERWRPRAATELPQGGMQRQARTYFSKASAREPIPSGSDGASCFGRRIAIVMRTRTGAMTHAVSRK